MAGKNPGGAEPLMAARQSIASELLAVIQKESFTKIVCGVDDRRGTNVEAVKRKYASLMKQHWVDTSGLLNSDGSPRPVGVYETFGRIVNKSGYEVKEEVIEWICDNRRELAANMSIAFSQKKLNIASWITKVEKDNYAADEFVLYSLCRLYDIHCILLTKFDPWSTISRQFSMTVEEVWAKSDLRLIFLEPGCYGEIKNIRQPPTGPPPSSKSKEASVAPVKKQSSGRSTPRKTTIRKDATRSRSKTGVGKKGDDVDVDRVVNKSRTLQEARDNKYGISTSRPVRDTRKKIDYYKLNDGLDESKDESPPPKKPRMNPLPSRSGPSAVRMSAQKSPPHKSPRKRDKLIGGPASPPPPELHGVTEEKQGEVVIELSSPSHKSSRKRDKLLGGPKLIGVTTSDASLTTGEKLKTTTTSIASEEPNEEMLPDLVVNRPSESPKVHESSVVSKILGELDVPELNLDRINTEAPTTSDAAATCEHPEAPYLTDAVVVTDTATTEDEEDAAQALLQLGTDMNFDSIDDNSTLMPIGARLGIVPEDIAPVPIKLSKEDVKQAVSQLAEDEDKGTIPQAPVSSAADSNENNAPVSDNTEDNTNSTVNSPVRSPKKGVLKVKEYGIKKKAEEEKLKFKCVNCQSRFKSRKECNKHYTDNHPTLLCTTCNKFYNTPASLSLHMYEHEELRHVCKRCGKGFHFKGQLTQHKVDHRSVRTFKCMHANCDRWFKRKGDLVLHLETHKPKVWKCSECPHTTSCEKYLKDHVKSQHLTDKSDYKYKCAVCNKTFLYRMQLSRHKDTHLK